MTAPALAAPIARSPWIIHRRADLVWLLGSVAIGYAFLGAHLGLGVPAVTLWWAWILALDGPHVFATLSRTYFDRRERAERRALLLGSLAFFAAGPAFFALSGALGTPLPFHLFNTAAFLWAYWHVVRQHYGFLILYKRKAGDMAPEDNRADFLFLYVGLIAPLVSFALTHPSAVKMLGFAAEPPWARTISIAAWIAVGLVTVALIARQISLLRSGRPIHRAKLAFLAAAGSLSMILFSPPVVARADFLAFVIVVTSFHNVQYLALVWFHHQNRHHAPGGNAALSGAAAALSRRLWIFLAAGVAFTVAYRLLLGCTLGASPGCGEMAFTAPLAAGLTGTDLLVGFLWGFALQHYYLDQKIWRVGRDERLRRELKLG